MASTSRLHKLDYGRGVPGAARQIECCFVGCTKTFVTTNGRSGLSVGLPLQTACTAHTRVSYTNNVKTAVSAALADPRGPMADKILAEMARLVEARSAPTPSA